MKAIVLTGYSSGLGRAIHNNLVKVETNSRLFFIGRGLDQLKESKNRVYIQLDLSNLSDINSFEFDAYLKDIDELIFISNAGTIIPISPILDIKVEKLYESVNVNFLAPVLLISKFKKYVDKIKIINISSGAATKPVPYWSLYCANKSAIKMFLDTVSLEKEISVEHFDPGMVDTNMQAIIREKSKTYNELDFFMEASDNGKLQDPYNVATEICRMIL
jgi:benzil reductase ((S)-benzoin forming)